MLKVMFDQYEGNLNILVTGSARLDVFKRGGDSLMGRYFPYTLHPISIAEIAQPQLPTTLIWNPQITDNSSWDALSRFGGFPEPFTKAEQRFWTRWSGLLTQQLFKEDLRDLTQVQSIDQIEVLAHILSRQVGQLTSFTTLSNHVRVSIDTIRRWLSTLQALYFCFAVRPWHRNVPRALRKESKYYLLDWSLVEDVGSRAENLVAAALLKAVDWWTETGQGDLLCIFYVTRKSAKLIFW